MKTVANRNQIEFVFNPGSVLKGTEIFFPRKSVRSYASASAKVLRMGLEGGVINQYGSGNWSWQSPDMKVNGYTEVKPAEVGQEWADFMNLGNAAMAGKQLSEADSAKLKAGMERFIGAVKSVKVGQGSLF